MRRYWEWISLGIAAVAVATTGLLTACIGQFGTYITEERTGSVTVIFVNNTGARAAFSFGSYDALDKNPPGTITLQQLRLEANTSSAGAALPCRRDVSVGTAELVKRVVDTRTDLNTPNFDADSFDDTVHFSLAPPDSASAALPTAGEAQGVHKRLAVEYTCGDTLIFTFEEDPDAEGGFRIDFTVIPDQEPDDIPNE